ncbi:uncharacterized protein PGTG_21075 [Puccinia graminis f. sp. tritici CRL 75-36-700-3]|uniref:Tc1-like transposase DDE domain-containing protein n=1 Tax=Puccinia graminis f. sp. tritici (strain CRL 75-36-700-3 / race SCCL) TaxID=418459 RepID=H6QQB5_PUCGT|nr:uncharacterized protein PGTG_21075 [Puccinia graminis f. sp. tritici CRL 75-36-700-3]EHS64817.1 hypothetical protein PGTG_21075 [Puccinia graminis f. sp. tritici CRL 75-36-700-3]
MPFVDYPAAYKFSVVKSSLDGCSLDDINDLYGTLVSSDSLRRWKKLYEDTRTEHQPLYAGNFQRTPQATVHVSKDNADSEPKTGFNEARSYVGMVAYHSPESLVFTGKRPIHLNLSHCVDGVRRTKGWAPIGERTSRAPVSRATHRFNVIPAVSMDGLVTVLVQQETVCRNTYEFYLEHILLPMMNPFPGPRSVLVLDNASFHHNGRIVQLVEARGCRLLYLPPYSPDMNPIEKGFSILKSSLRRDGHLDGGINDGATIENHVNYVFTAGLMKKLFRGCGYID